MLCIETFIETQTTHVTAKCCYGHHTILWTCSFREVDWISLNAGGLAPDEFTVETFPAQEIHVSANLGETEEEAMMMTISKLTW